MIVSELADALNEYVPRVLRATRVPGLALAIGNQDGLIFESGFGLADLATNQPMTSSTTIPVGSLSKPVAAAAFLRLDEQGHISMHDALDHYLTFPVRNPFGPTAVTPYHLLTHSSGLRLDTYYASLEPIPTTLGHFLEELLAKGEGREYPHPSGSPLWVAPVNDRAQYSSLGIALVAHALETVTGLSYGDYVTRSIFEPLGMADSYIPTTPPTPLSISDRLATGYMRFGNWCVPTPTLHTAIPPSAGMLTSMKDYVAFLLGLVNRGTHNGRRFLAEHSVRQMLTPRCLTMFPYHQAQHVGLALQMGNLGRPDYFVGHSGAFPFGWWADGRLYPDLGIAVAAGQNAWDVSQFHNNRTATEIVCKFVAQSFAAHRPTTPSPPLPYQLAYSHGLLAADRICGLLGAGSLDETLIRNMVDGARPVAVPDADTWDASGFLDALRSTAHLDPSPEAFQGFLESPACGVSPDDLRLTALVAGVSRGELRVPFGFFVDRSIPDSTGSAPS